MFGEVDVTAAFSKCVTMGADASVGAGAGADVDVDVDVNVDGEECNGCLMASSLSPRPPSCC